MEAMSDAETPREPAPESTAQQEEVEYPVPPATFDYLVFSLRAQTEMHLGLLHFGEE